MTFYIYTASLRDAKKVLNFIKDNNLQHSFVTFDNAYMLGFAKLHVIQVFLTDAEVDKYLADLEDFRLSVAP